MKKYTQATARRKVGVILRAIERKVLKLDRMQEEANKIAEEMLELEKELARIRGLQRRHGWKD